jgi:predicted Zn-ribbon and HTH transcriptional regulator
VGIKQLVNLIKPPCKKCPYKLGEVHFPVSPCPGCKLNNYQMYQILAEGKYKYPKASE